MPLDINMLRADRGGDPEKVRESQRRRFASVELVNIRGKNYHLSTHPYHPPLPHQVDQVIALDDAWRKLTGIRLRRLLNTEHSLSSALVNVGDIDKMKKNKNSVQKEVGTKKKSWRGL